MYIPPSGISAVTRAKVEDAWAVCRHLRRIGNADGQGRWLGIADGQGRRLGIADGQGRRLGIAGAALCDKAQPVGRAVHLSTTIYT